MPCRSWPWQPPVRSRSSMTARPGCSWSGPMALCWPMRSSSSSATTSAAGAWETRAASAAWSCSRPSAWSPAWTRSWRRSPVSDEPAHVTIVAHDLGEIGGMERQLNELVTGLLDAGHRVTVVARTCVLEPHERLRWVRVPGPGRPFAIAYPWFFLAGSLLARRHRADVLHTTGAIVLNRAEISTVHLCHHAVAEQGDLKRARRTTLAYRLNGAVASRMSRLAERLVYRAPRSRELVAVSQGVQREIDRYFPAMADRVVV